jgi:hypothetical protein
MSDSAPKPKYSETERTIIEAIQRCELVCNPAVLDRRKFSVHVRKVPSTSGTIWIVRCVDKLEMGKVHWQGLVLRPMV